MAIYMNDIVDINLESGSIHRSFLNHTIGSGDTNANRFGVRTFRNGVAEDLSGCSCQAVFMNAAGTNIALTSYGTVSGNEAYVTLPQACYNVEGQFCLAIKLIKSGVTVTSRIVDGVVCNTGTTGAVVPTSSVPTYQEILDVYAAMQSATSAANTAIADTFNAATAYPAGKYVINDGALYRLTADHAANVTWANTSKVATNLGNETADLKSAISDIKDATIADKDIAPTNTTRGYWDISNDVASIITQSSGSLYAFPAVEVTPGKQYRVNIGCSNNHPPVIIANYSNGQYNVVSTITVGSTGRNTFVINIPESGVTHLLLTKYGVQDAYVYRSVQKTDKTLLLEDVAADSKSVNDRFIATESTINARFGATESDIQKISDGKKNLLYFTDDTNRTLSNGVSATFQNKSQVTLVNEIASSGSTKLLLNGNTEYDSEEFKKNISAGTYYFYFNNGISYSRVYPQYRYSNGEVSSPRTGTLTLTEDAEMWIVVTSGATYSGAIQFMLSTEEIPYQEYGYLTAVDKEARKSITSVEVSLDTLEDVVDGILNDESQGSDIDTDALIYKKTQIIPAYYFASPDDPDDFVSQEYLEKRISAIPEGKHFIFYTDPHWTNNQQNSTALIQYIRRRKNIKTVLCGGDVLNVLPNKYKGSMALAKYINEMTSAFGENNFLATFGDHDNNTANIDTEQESTYMIPWTVVEKWFTGPVKNKAVRESIESLETKFASLSSADREEVIAYMRMHYYIDDEKQKIRYIVLTSGAGHNGIIGSLFGLRPDQEVFLEYTWFANVLKTVPANYDVVVLLHNGITYKQPSGSETYELGWITGRIYRMLSARLQKGSFTVDYSSSPLGTQTLQDIFPEASSSTTYDFSDATSLNNAIVLSGDIHVNIYAIGTTAITPKDYRGRTIQVGDVLAVTTQTDNKTQYTVKDRSETDWMYPDSMMSVGTISEQAIDVVTINGHEITFTRFGAGVDRTFDMTGASV